MNEVMLSTIDNPYNPFTEFDEWYAFDEEQARKEDRPTCCSYLARMFLESDDVSDEELNEITEAIIDDICELNLTGKFVKVTLSNADKLTEKANDQDTKEANESETIETSEKEATKSQEET